MKGTSHAAVGLLAGVTVAVVTWKSKELLGIPIEPIAVVLTSAAGALKADFDQKNSSGRRGYEFLWALAEKTPLVSKFFGHRGWATHSYWVPAFIIYIAFLLIGGGETKVSTIIGSLLIGSAIGFISHCHLDVYNSKGAPLLFPIPFKFSLASVISDSWQEAVFIPIVILGMIAHITLLLMEVTL